jgi:hypothetical protein
MCALETISDDSAEALSTHEGTLALCGLQELGEKAARALARNDGDLLLDSLTSLTKPVTEALAKHEGALSLDGLGELSETEAKALSKHPGGLCFGGLKTLTVGVARILAGHEGDLSLSGLENFPEEAFDIFSDHNGSVSIPMLTDIESVAGEVNDNGREFIVGLDFNYCDVNYSGFQIMERAHIRGLLAVLETDAKIGTPNMPGDWWEEFDVALLKGCFVIHSPWPPDIKAMRKLFGESVGQTSLFDSVMERAPSGDELDNDEDSEDEKS